MKIDGKLLLSLVLTLPWSASTADEYGPSLKMSCSQLVVDQLDPYVCY